MTVASVRRSLKLEGRSASIRELVKQRNQIPFQPNVKFPVSLRKFIGALPPGRILKKVISLKLLQSKLDEFINTPKPPPLQIRLHGSHFGVSTLFVFLKNKIGNDYDRKNPLVERDLAGPGEVLEFSGLFSDHRFRFNDVNSNSFKVKIVPGEPAGIEIVVRFETEGGENGEEIRVEDFPDIDFDGFNITLKMEFGFSRGALDLVSWVDEIDAAMEKVKLTSILNSGVSSEVNFRGQTFKSGGVTPDDAKTEVKRELIKQFIIVNVSVNVGGGVPDGTVAGKIKRKLTGKIFDALKDDKTRNALNQKVNPFLLGGDFQVTKVSNDDKNLTIEYLVPPGQVEPFPETPQAALDRGLLANIDHIVVLMMENRSFDHMLGYLSKDGGREDVDGLSKDMKNTFRGKDFKPLPLKDTVFEKGPCHEHECVVNQVAGNMAGFVADYAHHREDEGGKPGDVMGHYTAQQVPVYDDLARDFLICQRWFAAHPGPTFPNRFYTLTGRLNRDADGRFEFDNPHGSDFVPSFTRTIFDHLNEHGVKWHYYENGYCFLRLFDRYTFDEEFIVKEGITRFEADAKAGKLPSVSFIDPDFIDVPPGNDDGPPADIAEGQRLVGRVVNAVIKSPNWSKTLLVITYDEHGGFFDHVPPPAAIPVSAINEYGVRVPTFVVSPWVDQKQVSNTLFDHTSIAKTIARRFMSSNPPDMGERMAAANDLSAVLRSTPRTDKPTIRVPPAPAKKVALAATSQQNGENGQDFKGILRAMRAQSHDRKA